MNKQGNISENIVMIFVPCAYLPFTHRHSVLQPKENSSLLQLSFLLLSGFVPLSWLHVVFFDFGSARNSWPFFRLYHGLSGIWGYVPAD